MLPLVRDFKVSLITSNSDYFPISLTPDNPREACADAQLVSPVVVRIAWDFEKSRNYTESMLWSNRIKFDFNKSSIEDQSDNLKKAILESANSLSMVRRVGGAPVLHSQSSKPWFDSACRESKKEVDKDLLMFKKSGFSGAFGAIFLDSKKRYANFVKLNFVKLKRKPMLINSGTV